MKLKFLPFAAGAALMVPALTFAQAYVATVPDLFEYALSFINGILVPVLFAIAFLMFLVGVYRYFISGGGNAEKVQEGQKFVMWALIGFFVMFSIWGLVNVLVNTLGFGGASMPAIPTFNGIGGSGSSYGATYPSSSGSSSSGLFGSLFGGGPTGSATSGGPTGSATSGGPTGSATGSGAGNNGASCTNNTQCTAPNSACDDATATCQPDGPNNFSCSDDTTPNGNGMCGNGSYPSNSNGAQAPADGSVGQGGSCLGNEDACASGTCDADNVCADEGSENSVNADGTKQCDFGTVASNLNCVLCSDDSTTADKASDCPASASGGSTDSEEDDGT